MTSRAYPKQAQYSARGAYCGGLGYIDPNGYACFNVAIRTIILENGNLRYNVGSGLVLDSEAADEYGECLLKADVLKAQSTDLIETFLWDVKTGVIRLEAHKYRLQKAAKVLGFPFNDDDFDKALLPLKNCKTNQRVRLTLDKSGAFKVSHTDYTVLDDLKFSISKHALTANVQTTAHKISNRQFYDGERERIGALTGADEVLFLNKDNQLCEGSFTSLFVEKNGQLYTPPLSAGLLPGILRAELIQTGKAAEKTLTLNDFLSADNIYLGNSLRGLIPATLMSSKRL